MGSDCPVSVPTSLCEESALLPCDLQLALNSVLSSCQAIDSPMEGCSEPFLWSSGQTRGEAGLLLHVVVCRGGCVVSQAGFQSSQVPRSAQWLIVLLMHFCFTPSVPRPGESCIVSSFLFVCFAQLVGVGILSLASRKGPLRNIHVGILFGGKKQYFRGERERLGSALGFTLALMWALSCFHWETLTLKLRVTPVVLPGL